MMTLGELLRIGRTEKKIPLDAIVDAIKVNKKVLESLEQDRIDPEMPPVYVRGFILSYCRYVGIDAQEALDLYEGEQKSPAKGQGDNEQQDDESIDTPRRAWPLILIVLVGLGLLAYVGFITFSTDRGATVSPPPPAEEPIIPSPLVSDEPKSPPLLPAEPAPEPAPDDTAGPAAPEPEEPPAADPLPSPEPPEEQIIIEEEAVAEIEVPDVTAQERVRVQLVTTAEAWIQATVDNESPVDKIYRPGNSATWEGADKIELRLGNVGGVNLVVNGIPMKPFGKPNQVMWLTFTDTTVSINRGQPQDLEMWRADE